MDAAATVKAVEQVPDIPMFRKNTAAFVHEMPAAAIANVDGDSNYVRVQVLTNAGRSIATSRSNWCGNLPTSLRRQLAIRDWPNAPG